MTYAVNGLRELTVGGIDSRLWMAIAVLLTVLCAALGASAWAASRNRQFTMNRLDPPIRV
jgi:putative membrane protein